MKPKDPLKHRPHGPGPGKPSKAERRAGWRFGCSSARLTRLYLSETQEFLYGWLNDISAGGISFELLTPVKDGQELEVQLRTSDSERVELPARVVYVSFNRGFCRVGCRFVRPLEPAVFAAIVQQLRECAREAIKELEFTPEN